MDSTAFTLSQENDLPIIVFNMNKKGNLLKVISEEIELVVVTRNGIKSSVNYIEYSKLTDKKEYKKLPSEIVSEEYLANMRTQEYLRF